MMRFIEKTKASVSVFLIFALMPFYTLIYLAVDYARYESARAKTAGASNLTANAALSDYDRTFKELYGLFVMSKAQDEMTLELMSYFSGMTDINEQSPGSDSLLWRIISRVSDKKFENTVRLQTEDFSAEYLSPVWDTKELDLAIRSFMKYRAPYSWTRGFAGKISAFSQTEGIKNVTEKSSDFHKSAKDADAELRGLYNALSKALESDDPDETAKVLSNVKKTLSKVKKELKKTLDKADAWSGSIESLDDGEVKELLRSEYEGFGEALNTDAVESFENTLQGDAEALLNREEEEEVKLKFPDDPFYLYLKTNYGKKVSSSENGGAQKSAMEKIASTELSLFSKDVPTDSITAAVSEEILKIIYETESKSDIDIKGLSRLKDAALNAYEVEYISGMCGCLTTKESDKNLLGVPFGARPFLSAECEYIVFGRDNPAVNAALCTDLIFALRLIMNTVYVCTNPAMRSEALAVAAAVAGWTGIGIPAAQNAVLLAWAAAESVLDTASLCKGESVPIYKSAATWTLSLSGLPAVLAKETVQYAAKGIDDVFEKIESAALGKTEEAEEAALSFLENTAGSAAQNLAGMVATPVERAVTLLTMGINVHISRDDVRNAVLSALDCIDSSSAGLSKAKELFVTYCLDELTDKITESLPFLLSNDASLSGQASKKVSDAINGAYETLYSKISDTLDSVKDDAQSRIKAELASASESAKAKSVEIINGYAEEIAEFTGESSDNSVSKSSALGMTYKDYLKLFMLLGMTSEKGKENMLKRLTVVMQINCENKKSGFEITGCFREIKLCTVTGVGTHSIRHEEAYHY